MTDENTTEPAPSVDPKKAAKAARDARFRAKKKAEKEAASKPKKAAKAAPKAKKAKSPAKAAKPKKAAKKATKATSRGGQQSAPKPAEDGRRTDTESVILKMIARKSMTFREIAAADAALGKKASRLGHLTEAGLIEALKRLDKKGLVERFETTRPAGGRGRPPYAYKAL